MTKSQFKEQYSAYRKALKNQFPLGRDAFLVALNSNQMFRSIQCRDVRPVSIKCWLAFN
jgi:hypothetical protein